MFSTEQDRPNYYDWILLSPDGVTRPYKELIKKTILRKVILSIFRLI